MFSPRSPSSHLILMIRTTKCYGQTFKVLLPYCYAQAIPEEDLFKQKPAWKGLSMLCWSSGALKIEAVRPSETFLSTYKPT
jgi:hypothetical protein